MMMTMMMMDGIYAKMKTTAEDPGAGGFGCPEPAKRQVANDDDLC